MSEVTGTLRPSSAPRWMVCPGSVRLIAETPERPESDAAREGTCAAWVAEVVLRGDATSAWDMTGKTHANGWMVDDGMASLVQDYIDRCLLESDDILVEQQVSFGLATGTLDSAHVNEVAGIGNVRDLKFGYKIVEPNSWQLVIYALGLFTGNGPYANIPIAKVRLTIDQPRAHHPDGQVRSWEFPIQHLKVTLANLVREGMARTQEPDAKLIPSDQCLYCPAAHRCAALTGTIYDLWEPVQETRALDIDDGHIGAELSFLKRMETLVKARTQEVEADVETRIKTKRFVPGWTMGQRKGKRQFNVDASTIQMLTGKEPHEKKLKSPAALERERVPKAVIKSITHTPDVGSVLMPVTDTTFDKLFPKRKDK